MAASRHQLPCNCGCWQQQPACCVLPDPSVPLWRAGAASWIKHLRPDTLRKLQDANKYDYQVYNRAVELHDRFVAAFRVIQTSQNGLAARASAYGHAAAGVAAAYAASRPGTKEHKRRRDSSRGRLEAKAEAAARPRP